VHIERFGHTAGERGENEIMRHWKSLVVFLVITFAAAATGTLSAPDAWFNALSKPWFNPPTWVFPPVWTALYVLMAIAAWRVYRVSGFGSAIALWIAQLVCNAAWTPLFFGWHRVDLAFADIALLVLLIIATTVAFFRRDRIAGALMVPYLGWVGFATALTFAIWRLNP
jgi:translocator protein